MTVLELIQELQQIRVENGDDVEVKFAYPSGDYWKTVVCTQIDSVQMLAVKHSEYHDMDRLMEEEELIDLEDEGKEPKEVCVLR